MTKARVVQMVTVGVAIVGLASVMAAQGPARGPSSSALDDLLAEVRGLRAELTQAAGASMRMQLLVARLSLQEQRITSLGRQSAEVQKQWVTAMQERTQTEAALKQIQGALPPASANDPPNASDPLSIMKLKIAQLRQQEEQFRLQEAELSNALAGEQGRWADFNGRLDDLERSLAAGQRR